MNWMALFSLLVLLLFADAIRLVQGQASTIVDLSQEWALGSLYNRNKAYCTLQANLNPRATRGYVVIQNGEILAEGYTEGHERNGTYDAWSSTKSWSTMLVGKLVEMGKLSTSDTLNDIFDQDDDWEGVPQAVEKKTVTVEELLTMTSGLREADCGLGLVFSSTLGCELGPFAQESFQAVMKILAFSSEQRGTFAYLPRSHIVSRIIERRSGLTPKEFVNQNSIFQRLGISETDYNWLTFGGVEGSAYGLQFSPRVLAKLGQLYLQDGMAKEGDQLIPAEWVESSTTNQLGDDDRNSFDIFPELTGYGYQWYTLPDNGQVGEELEGAALAAGAEGQQVLYLPASNTVIAVMGQGSNGVRSSQVFIDLVVRHLDDLHVEQTECDKEFSGLRYYVKNAGPFVIGNAQSVVGALSISTTCVIDTISGDE